MLNKHIEYKYETTYTGTFFIMQGFTNGTVNLQCGVIIMTYNMCRIKPYKYDTNVKYINPKNMCDDVNI